MEAQEIKELLASGIFAGQRGKPRLRETHISWIILAGKHAYKIKKPLQFSFLDFSTPAKRKYYCEREVQLNRRLAARMYIKVLPIFHRQGRFSFDQKSGRPIDYAVLMHRMKTAKEMDKLLVKGRVSPAAIGRLAKRIAAFHQNATVISKAPEIGELRQRYNDLLSVREFVATHSGAHCSEIIGQAIKKSDRYLNQNRSYLQERLTAGFTRDVHGDLHPGNIFLYRNPIIFDCIEFNDGLRQIDILDEAAFLCMGLEAFQRPDLSSFFYKNYLRYAGIRETRESKQLFNYYKSYRANVRAKVHTLNAEQAADEDSRLSHQQESEKYLALLKSYLPEF